MDSTAISSATELAGVAGPGAMQAGAGAALGVVVRAGTM